MKGALIPPLPVVTLSSKLQHPLILLHKIQRSAERFESLCQSKTIKRGRLDIISRGCVNHTLNGTDMVMTERDWTDTEFLSSAKPPTWGYPASKTLAEKEAWRFAEEKTSISLPFPSLMTGNDFLINTLKGMQMLSGSISIKLWKTYVERMFFLAEQESASGRYICCAVNSSVPELAKFLHKRYPEFEVPTDFGDCPSKAKLIISSEKLINEGFSFKFGIEEIFDQTVEYLKDKGLLNHWSVHAHFLSTIRSGRRLINLLPCISTPGDNRLIDFQAIPVYHFFGILRLIWAISPPI
ncbi:salt overly sensitive 1 [Hibiscus syriacus]|uniref:Salt overly sensitive 1 n=1 Tax=Hibiscus syriacus TaxID=106335 RepID=A0A6A3CGP5_HIBSY|nr:salt overly sensitive 1 [Hibiscus syriacus]